MTSFENVCKSVKESNATKKHIFLSSLPADMKFEMQEFNSKLYEQYFNDLLDKALEVAGGKQ